MRSLHRHAQVLLTAARAAVRPAHCRFSCTPCNGAAWRRLCLVLTATLAGCASTGGGLARAQAAADYPVYVTRHGHHTGLAVRAHDLPPGAWPAHRRFADARYIKVGWGDRAYYPETEPGVLLGVRALLWPTDSTVHAVGVAGTLQAEFPDSEIVTLRASREGLDRLIHFVAASHERDVEGRPRELGPSRHENSVFYASPRRFHLFETCNTWVARALREAGLPVSTQTVTAGSLIRQARALEARQRAHEAEETATAETGGGR